jgi:catechol 2,3-dioxygenase-like lactoylglutathione lyase family enzyme
MLLDPQDQFHTGIVVDDFEGARDWITATLGYEWGPDVQMEYTALFPSGPITYQQRLQYSVTEPRFELVQSVEGTALHPSSSGLHHVGYWCSDVEAVSADLVANGWAWESGGTMGAGGPAAWAYHFNPLGVRIELVNRAMQSTMSMLWTPTKAS